MSTVFQPAIQPCVDAETRCMVGAKEALNHWATTVATRDVDLILSLYAPDAILVPTLSNRVRDCEDSRRSYFFASEGLVCDVQVFKKRVSRKLGTVVVGGLYTFAYRQDGEQHLVPEEHQNCNFHL